MVLEDENQEHQVVHVALHVSKSCGDISSKIKVNGVGCANGNLVQLASRQLFS